ncbi:NeuD/PglB/VioB family sugar acetyltransferase [Amycolatopsis alkalitolerans]|uniref:Acyltransferase n=1 Tax=Amycolatopsis alkalitolerans TaxID=2547244 RepID=A0A5C4LVH2_9PSEU|nr:NeuD/PglB/VioB family sugar acetyltransferase [Amycolatopsis alkalitolerans]TNC21884.1 acyltransferase [Amycolatopsis alkalitolerans]
MTRDSGRSVPIHIVGAGGLGRETLDALFARGCERDSLVLVDDHVVATELHGVPVRRPDDVRDGLFVVAIADPGTRRRLATRMLERGLVLTSVVHPRATLAHDVRIPAGCLVLANAFISTGTRLAAHTQVQYNATIGHDSVLHEFVTVLPGANVAGNVVLETAVTVGSNASVLQGLVVGARTFIGAGAVVTKNHLGDRVLVGVPARDRGAPAGMAGAVTERP